MQSDRELLELAARAAGICIDKSPYNGGGHGNTGFNMLGDAVLDWHNGKTWNPLTDDGDALRLAVRTGEPFVVRSRCVTTMSGLKEDFDPSTPGDDLRAVRRIIVRAAAAIGGDSNG